MVIDGKTFRLVKLSRRGEVSVYTSGDLYARVGERAVVESMLALHKKFEGFGFPVASIVGRGEISVGAYFLEESLGDKHFSELFFEDTQSRGTISPELFDQFVKTTEKYAEAQLRSAISDKNTDLFTVLIKPQDLAEELPEHGGKILKLYDEALVTLAQFPFVLTQGDFNPHNLFPRGVIDFEQTYYGPAGYDIVTNIFSINYFPKSTEYEYFQRYCFTAEQEHLYYERMDVLYLKMGLPKLSEYKKHLEYCRAIWATKQNFRAPKLQQWRYELFKKTYL